MNVKLTIATCCIAIALTSMARAQETEVSRKDVPPAVLSAMNKDYPSAKVLEWEKETHGGKLYYEAETVDGKVARNVLYSPDGSTAQVEEKIASKDIPQNVLDAARQQYPNSTVRSAYKVTHVKVIEYALNMSGTSPSKLVVSSDGKIVSTEGKKDLDWNP